MKTEVIVAWYSTESGIDRYHLCVDCWQYKQMFYHHLRIAREERLPDGLTLCETCETLMDEEDHEPVVLEVTLQADTEL